MGREGGPPRRHRARRRLRRGALPGAGGPDRQGIRQARRSGQQRGIPGNARLDRGDQRRGVGLHLPYQRLRIFLSSQGSGRSDAARRQHHRHLVGQREITISRIARLRDHEGRYRQLHRRVGAVDRAKRSTRQLRRARPGLDAADPIDDAGRESETVRQPGSARSPGAARRTRRALRDAGLRRVRATSRAPTSLSPAASPRSRRPIRHGS